VKELKNLEAVRTNVFGGGPSNRLTAARIAWRREENIFGERGEADPLESAIRAWEHSSGHRRNILTRRFTPSGIGVAVGRDGTYMITPVRGVLTETKPIPHNNEKSGPLCAGVRFVSFLIFAAMG
jgi:hypothetical protein